MRKSIPIALLMVFVFGLIVLAPGQESVGNPPDFVFTKPAKVIKIRDGDTFEVIWKNGYQDTIRPASVDTPELKTECFDIKATVWVSNLLLGHWVWLSRLKLEDTIRDKYGRLLARVYLDSERTANFGKIMISQGFAKADERFPRGKEVLQPLENEARKAERGLWGICENP